MSFNIKSALRAKFWTSTGETPAALPPPPDQAGDNNYQSYAYNSARTGGIPTFKEANASNQFEINNGHAIIDNSLTINGVAVPATPTVAVSGTAGATTYTYKVVGRAGSLQAPSATVTITTGNATLSGTNYNTISFLPTAGFLVYDIYRTVGGSTTGRIGQVTAAFNLASPTLTFVDSGLTADASTAPTVNTTGAMTGDLNVYGNLNLVALATPAAPLVTPTGTTGASTWAYKIVARCGSILVATGHTAASAAGSTTTGNATLSASNYNALAWQPVVGATTYDIYRTTAATSPSTTGLIASTTASTYNDIGAAGDSGTAPITNTTGVSSLPNSTTAALAAITDTNGNPEIIFVATGSAVNGLTETNSATGNPVTLATSGADTNVGFTINSKGTGAVTIAPGAAGGTIVIGKSDQTGTITLGSSSGTEAVAIAAGAGINTVTVANVSTAGSTVTLAGAATATGITDTINIGTGNTVGTGSKVVHIADGTPAGTNVVTIGSNANTANTTTIKGGNGTGAITLTPQTTGTIVIGAAAGTGAIGIGTSSATQVVNIGNGAGVATVNLSNTSVAGANVNVATAATGAGITDTVAISTGNAAATGIKVVNIATGTPGTSGNNRVTVGGGTTSAVTINAVVTSYQSVNYQGTEGGANNAITFNLTDAGGTAVTLAAGLRVSVKLAHSLQAGANTAVLNGAGGTKAIKSHCNPANDIGTAYVSGGIIDMLYDGTQWLDMSQ